MKPPSFGSGEEAGKETIGVKGSPRQAVPKSCRLTGGTLRMGFRFVQGILPGRKGNLKTVWIIQPIPGDVNFQLKKSPEDRGGGKRRFVGWIS
jgi:hypothetical protein